MDDQVVGFSDLHYQRQGIAKTLVEKLESEAEKLNLLEIKTDASITAMLFWKDEGTKSLVNKR